MDTKEPMVGLCEVNVARKRMANELTTDREVWTKKTKQTYKGREMMMIDVTFSVILQMLITIEEPDVFNVSRYAFNCNALRRQTDTYNT